MHTINLITYCHTLSQLLKGSRATGAQNLVFPIDFDLQPYNSDTGTHCDEWIQPDTTWKARKKRYNVPHLWNLADLLTHNTKTVDAIFH